MIRYRARMVIAGTDVLEDAVIGVDDGLICSLDRGEYTYDLGDVVIAPGWPIPLSVKSRGIELHGGQIVSATRWAGLVASWKAATGASPRECTGAPMSVFAGSTTPSQIAPWSGSWIT